MKSRGTNLSEAVFAPLWLLLIAGPIAWVLLISGLLVHLFRLLGRVRV